MLLILTPEVRQRKGCDAHQQVKKQVHERLNHESNTICSVKNIALRAYRVDQHQVTTEPYEMPATVPNLALTMIRAGAKVFFHYT